MICDDTFCSERFAPGCRCAPISTRRCFAPGCVASKQSGDATLPPCVPHGAAALLCMDLITKCGRTVSLRPDEVAHAPLLARMKAVSVTPVGIAVPFSLHELQCWCNTINNANNVQNAGPADLLDALVVRPFCRCARRETLRYRARRKACMRPQGSVGRSVMYDVQFTPGTQPPLDPSRWLQLPL